MYVTRHIGRERREKSCPPSSPSITAFNIVVNIKECRRVILELKGKFDVFLFISNVLFLKKKRTQHRQPKLNIREPLNYKDLYGNTTDSCKMVETNIVLSVKST